MSKSRIAPRIGGALAILLVLISLIACAESSKSPADDNSETAAITDYTATVEARAGNVTVENDSTASRSLEASDPEYTSVESSALYWTYTAVKDDGYFTTGQSEFDDEGNPVETDLNGGSAGLPDGSFGTFSVGDWIFTFNAYQEVTSTDDDENKSTSLELYYQGIETSKTLTASDYTVSVNVQLVEADAEYGTVTFSGIYFVSVDEDGNETTVTLNASSLDDVILSVLMDDEEVTTDTSILDSSKILSSSSDTSSDGSVTIDNVEPGYHTVYVYLYASDGTTVLAESSVEVLVRSGLDTEVTGSLVVAEADAELDDDIAVTYGSVSVSTVSQLAAALADSEISTVVLTDDISSSGTFVVTGDTTIDLSEYTLTTSTYYAFSVSEGASLTISNGTVEGASFSTFILSGEESSLTVESGTYSGAYYCVYDNTTDAEVTINGGTFSVTGTYSDDAVFTTSYGSSLTLNINGGTFDGGTQGIGVMVAAGSSADITITGGEFTSSNMAFYVNGSNSSSDITIDISGGTFNGLVYIAGYTTTTISGGTFTNSAMQALHVRSGSLKVTGGTFQGTHPSGGYDYEYIYANGGSVALYGDIVVEALSGYPLLSLVVAESTDGSLSLQSGNYYGIQYYLDPSYSSGTPEITVDSGLNYTAHTGLIYRRQVTTSGYTSWCLYYSSAEDATATTYTVTIYGTDYTLSLGDLEVQDSSSSTGWSTYSSSEE